jgi:hypothetical protein
MQSSTPRMCLRIWPDLGGQQLAGHVANGCLTPRKKKTGTGPALRVTYRFWICTGRPGSTPLGHHPGPAAYCLAPMKPPREMRPLAELFMENTPAISAGPAPLLPEVTAGPKKRVLRPPDMLALAAAAVM